MTLEKRAELYPSQEALVDLAVNMGLLALMDSDSESEDIEEADKPGRTNKLK